jgi:hypothetical protein
MFDLWWFWSSVLLRPDFVPFFLPKEKEMDGSSLRFWRGFTHEQM